MFFKSKYGARIQIANQTPWNLSRGGIIPYSNFLTDEKDEDTINSLLADGSLVIPRKIVPIMKHCPFPITGAVERNKKNLLTTIVQPEEMVVNKKYANKVLAWLLKQGITLPLPVDSVV